MIYNPASSSPRRFATGVLLAFVTCSAFAQHRPRVKLGIDVLLDDHFAPLRGKRVGLITNPTGVAGDLRSTIDILHRADSVDLVALFGPEHGVRGETPAGAKIDDARDPATGLRVFSLYGKTRKPTQAMLANVDVLVFDIQDIGSRSYTYISTMAAAMSAAAEFHKQFVVLDRPNPLGGVRVEGRPLNLKFKSFVGYLPIPYVHGLTVGELARMINREGWLGEGRRCELTVVPMKAWTREMLWQDTGLFWIPTSPHVPDADTPLYYAATGIMGELQVISEGVGTPQPFELCGRPGIDPRKLAAELNARGLAGVTFRPTFFQPFYTRLAGRKCGGVHILFSDPRGAALTPIQFHVMDAVRRLYPQTRLFGGKRDASFDKVCGTDRVREMFQQGRPLDEILAYWSDGVAGFRQRRKPYLLYK